MIRCEMSRQCKLHTTGVIRSCLPLRLHISHYTTTGSGVVLKTLQRLTVRPRNNITHAIVLHHLLQQVILFRRPFPNQKHYDNNHDSNDHFPLISVTIPHISVLLLNSFPSKKGATLACFRCMTSPLLQQLFSYWKCKAFYDLVSRKHSVPMPLTLLA